MGERSEESRKEILLSLPLKKREKDKKYISTLVSSGYVTNLLQGSVIKNKNKNKTHSYMFYSTRDQGCMLVSVGSFSGRICAQAQEIILGVGWSWLVLAGFTYRCVSRWDPLIPAGPGCSVYSACVLVSLN